MTGPDETAGGLDAELDESRSVDHVGDIDEDVVVLPWWQRPLNIFTLLVATALVAGMVGSLVREAVAEPGADEVDIGFLQDMRVHHEQAVQMAMIYRDRPDTDQGLRTIATTIVFGQSIDIGRMIQLLRDADADEARDESTPAMTWMGMSMTSAQMPGMATDDQIGELASATGPEADELFVQMMSAHHRGGIEMAEFAAGQGEDDEVRAFAEAMLGSQRSDITEMEQQLER